MMKKIIIIICLLLLVCGCSESEKTEKMSGGITSITCEKALDLQAEEGTLVDVRESDEYKDSHLEGAVNVPLGNVVEEIEDYVADKDSVIIVYCKSGKRSAEAARKLQEAGYTKIYDLGSINNCS